MNYSINKGLKQYNQVVAQSAVSGVSPHRLIQMLLDGAINKITMAKGYMNHRDIANKGSHISWAIAIIGGLRGSLNKEAGGAIAQNLDDLYDYMCRRLVQANLDNRPELLDEVTVLLRELKNGWESIPPEVQKSAEVSEK